MKNIIFLFISSFINVTYAQNANYIKIQNTGQSIPLEKRKCYQDNSKERLDCLNKLFDQSLNEILQSSELVSEIKVAAGIYGIRPSLIAAAILGEHIFNYDYKDILQDKLALNTVIKVYPKDKYSNYLKYREKCSNIVTEYYKWICINNTLIQESQDKDNYEMWNTNKLARRTFTDSIIGGSFGIAQMQPIRALMITDLVSAKSGFKKLSLEKPLEIIETLTSDKEAIHYVAASIWYTVFVYKKDSIFDISESHGITSTLYNLGSEIVRARSINKLYQQDHSIRPQMNYYGWLMEYRKKALIKAFDN